MRGVLIEVPQSLLAERRLTGVDRFDEMWEGVLHMVPAPSDEHQRIGAELLVALVPAAISEGLSVRYEPGLYDPAAEPETSYRIPDLAAFSEEVRSARGIEGRAALVIEIRSPGDESFEKIPFYSRVGVLEMLIVDRDTKAVRRWVRSGEDLAEVEPGQEGWHALHALPVRLRGDAGKLVVEGLAGTAVI